MKLLKWFAIVLIAIPVVVISGIYLRNKAVGPEGWAMDNTTRALEAQMKDPGSMIIRSSYIVTRQNDSGDSEIYICGIVDGRNSFGGYTGGVRFASKSVSSKRLGTFDTHIVEMEDPAVKEMAARNDMLSAFEKVYWNEFCVDAAHPALTPQD